MLSTSSPISRLVEPAPPAIRTMCEKLPPMPVAVPTNPRESEPLGATVRSVRTSPKSRAFSPPPPSIVPERVAPSLKTKSSASGAPTRFSIESNRMEKYGSSAGPPRLPESGPVRNQRAARSGPISRSSPAPPLT